MADIDKLKDKIKSTIYPNGRGAINAADHQEMLLEIVYGIADADSRIESVSKRLNELAQSKGTFNKDGYYPQLSVGNANNLSGVDEVESEFNARQSGGEAIADGVARIQALKGNSIIWNQQSSGITIEGDIAVSLPMGARVVQGHKYILLCDAQENNPSLYLYGYVPGKNPDIIATLRGATSTFFVSQISLEATSSANTEGGLWWYQAGNANAKTIRPRLVNLTKMFGQGNEPTTIEDFNSRCPIGFDLYAYNAGQIVNLSAHTLVSKGINVWDGEKANLMAGTTYYLGGTYNSIAFNGVGFPLPGNRLFTPTIAGVITAMGKNICINISDSSINGQYYPHIKEEQDLSVILKAFPKGMCSAGSAYDEIRFNKESQKWEKVVRIKEVDLSTLDWYDDDFNGVPTFTTKSITNGVQHDYEAVGGSLIALYDEKPRFNELQLSDEKVFVFNSTAHSPNTLAVRDSRYSSADSFKSAINGVYIYYELDTPIVTELEDQNFNLDYSVWNYGTEQIEASEPSSALRATITYGFNAIGLIKQLRAEIAALKANM